MLQRHHAVVEKSECPVRVRRVAELDEPAHPLRILGGCPIQILATVDERRTVLSKLNRAVERQRVDGTQEVHVELPANAVKAGEVVPGAGDAIAAVLGIAGDSRPEPCDCQPSGRCPADGTEDSRFNGRQKVVAGEHVVLHMRPSVGLLTQLADQNGFAESAFSSAAEKRKLSSSLWP